MTKAVDTAFRNIHYHCLEYDHDQEGDIFLVACGMENCDKGVVYGPDVRDCYHLHVILSGTGTLKVGDLEFHPTYGQMFLLKHNERVVYQADELDPWSYCWVTFFGSEAKSLTEKIGFTDGVYCLDSSVESRAFYDLVRRMHEKPEMNEINDLRRRGILLEFLALAMEATVKPGAKIRRRSQKPVKEYVDKAVDFIHYNYATIQVADVTRFIGFTRSYFSTAFKKEVGMSLQDYLTHVRLDHAKKLLLETDYTVQEISQLVGCEDSLNFSKLFRRHMGISPTGFRNGQLTNKMNQEG